MSAIQRLPHAGAVIDRSKPMCFSFDGKSYKGYAGDTLASALLSHRVVLMGRSFKYHRPRGVLTSDSAEPNALVELRTGARQEPNTRATTIELFEGLSATSQNRWPSLAFDMMAMNDRLAPFLSAGFYYKTFMWPKAWWEKLYEPVIRRAAGLGRLSQQDDPDLYDKGYLHCDLLIIGAGVSGLSAALQAGRAGARVIVLDEDFMLGGRLLSMQGQFVDQDQQAWLQQTLVELSQLPNVRLMPRTTAYGAFDHGVYGALERVTDHREKLAAAAPRQILWRIYTKRSLLCAGASERPLIFANNDRPGIMLASAMQAYAQRWAVQAASRVAIFTNNDSGHQVAKDLSRLGIKIVALIDPRPDVPHSTDYPVIQGQVIDAHGRLALNAITVQQSDGRTCRFDVGALGVSGGWNPNVHLSCHQGGRPIWQENIAAFVPGQNLPVGQSVAGAAAGHMHTQSVLQSAMTATTTILQDLGFKAPKVPQPQAEARDYHIMPFWQSENPRQQRAWVDWQNDVTSKDIALAHQENFRSVEHVKRYTTMGMATDQGKNSNILGLAVMATLSGRTIPEVGTTTFRPPYTPVTIGALAGRSVGRDFRPTRYTPSHDWAQEHNAVFVEVGTWLRAQWFPRVGETHWRQSVDREVLQTRRSVGICDVTTLGKIDIQGSDAATFLNRIYCNGFAQLPIGKTRYGLMLREDGIVMDDGTTARLAEDHFIMTTTTANAVRVFRHLEFARQCLWPKLDVQCISITDAWAQYAIAGPNARRLLQKVVDPQYDISNESFPFMACAEVSVCGGLRARLFRISFSGELAYELAVPACFGDSLMRTLMVVGEEFDVVPYGTEALGVMRIEKGHPAGNELNGTTTALNLGLGRLVSLKKDSIGAVLSRRTGLCQDDDLRLVGFEPCDPTQAVVVGSHLVAKGRPIKAAFDQGYVTSACYSPHRQSYIALGFIIRGSERFGEVVRAVNPLEGGDVPVKIVSPHFFDPHGERLHA